VLLVHEASGSVTNFRGEPFSIDSRQVLATNGVLHAEMLKEFGEIMAGRVEGLPSVAEYLKS
jgi:myo-inositol-1(or 4)-monophosphatase